MGNPRLRTFHIQKNGCDFLSQSRAVADRPADSPLETSVDLEKPRNIMSKVVFGLFFLSPSPRIPLISF